MIESVEERGICWKGDDLCGSILFRTMDIWVKRKGVSLTAGLEAHTPLSKEAAYQFLQEGKLMPTDLAWHAGASGWEPLSEVLGISPAQSKWLIPPEVSPDGFDYSYEPAEGESTYKDGHLYMFEATCDKCNMEVMGPEKWFANGICPECGKSGMWIYDGADSGFWIEVDESSEDLIIIPHTIKPSEPNTPPNV